MIDDPKPEPVEPELVEPELVEPELVEPKPEPVSETDAAKWKDLYGLR